MNQFHIFILSWKSTCFGQFFYPSSGVYSLYTQVLLESCLQTCMTYTIAELQWINSWWWTDELSETCRVSCQNKFVELVHLIGFITNKFVTMHGHMNVKNKLIRNCQVIGWDERQPPGLKIWSKCWINPLKYNPLPQSK